MASRSLLYVLTGPTAVGKTALALEWAEANHAEIVSADSLLFYRGMDIGTAKPSPMERSRISHHLIDIVPPSQPVNIAEYVQRAQAAVAAIQDRGKSVLVTGGSGFYLKSFFGPVVDTVEVSAEIRAEVGAQLEEKGLPSLVKRLAELNPDGLAHLDTQNPRRVLRALERCLASGQTLAELKAAFNAQPGPFADHAVVGVKLERPVEELWNRIEQRAKAMLAAGLEDEVRALVAQGLRENPSAARSIGYRETLAMIDGEIPRDALLAAIVQNTRLLMRKQRTWFRQQLPMLRSVEAATAKAAGLFFD
jgi:tRNA dimethylallyltransferase